MAFRMDSEQEKCLPAMGIFCSSSRKAMTVQQSIAGIALSQIRQCSKRRCQNMPDIIPRTAYRKICAIFRRRRLRYSNCASVGESNSSAATFRARFMLSFSVSVPSADESRHIRISHAAMTNKSTISFFQFRMVHPFFLRQIFNFCPA